MGINNLLRFMKPHVQSVHIKKYSGERVGIDAYSWLHKGAYSCSMELCLNVDGDKKFQFLKYFMHRLNMLRHYNITPVVVFDGGNIPIKAATEDERHRHVVYSCFLSYSWGRRAKFWGDLVYTLIYIFYFYFEDGYSSSLPLPRRKANRDMAMEKLKEGNVHAASELFQILRLENIEFVVAPYEADAQLAYLSGLEVEEGGVVAVVSEDSDLLAYGCPAVVFKMDRYGNGEEIVLDKVFSAVGYVPSFKNFDRELLTGMCVLAGCDFLPSVPGVGIARAHNLVSKYRNFSRILSVLRFEKGKQMPEDYSEAFKEAVAVFQHARVYDAVKKQLKPLKPLTPDLLQNEDQNLDFLGPDLPPSLAIAIAQGNLDPCTMEAFNHFPQLGNQFNLNSLDSASRFLRQEEATVSNEGKLADDVPIDTVINGLAQQKPTIIVEEVLQSREILSLQNLVFPSKNETSRENVIPPFRQPSNIPNNNPFKKRKLEQVQTVEIDGQVSTVTETASLGPLDESQGSINSKPSALLTTNVGNVSRKLVKHRHCTTELFNNKSILNFFSRV
ncbi:exonuclease 1 [Dorcoceras hygrometricum]|uniref:Exonuclease 1 n=1 Tax=Dorcoceras hygrometricum TaxID=472368 RepID=A0A2Z7CNZ7_9LAMI|nr:exonuclease 1 [Dorcoceras hygrometricum]